MSEKTVFETLYELDVRDKLEKKKSGGTELDYLSWAQGWREVKKLYPNANYTIHRFGNDNLPYVFDPETGYMVFVSTTINELTYEMCLPVMDGANKAMKAQPYTYVVGFGEKQREKSVESATMFDINKTIMRALVKSLAMHGLGLSLYFKERIAPETVEKIKQEKDKANKEKENTIKNLQAEIVTKAKKLIESGVDSATIYAKIEEIGGKKNPNSIKDESKCEAVLEALEELNVKKEKK